ncbi:MAG TPA: choline kinase family protein [Solirubrobacteraceae bacterium]|nr:choline kinase family protein [Solirubrobacteraceae bacterium]
MSDLESLLARLEQRLGAITAGPTVLDGGITNRNYRVSFAGRDCVVRLPGKDTSLLGIDRRAECQANQRAAELGIAPGVVTADDECLVTEWVEGEPSEAASLDLEGVASALRAFHDSGLELAVRFWVPDLLDDYADVVLRGGGTLPQQYAPARELVGRIAQARPLSHPVPCHNDLLPGNVLRTSHGVRLVDWEYAGMGDRLFDLGNLAVNCQLDEAAELRLLTAYWGQPPSQEQRAALGLMRLMSDAREAAWGVVQGVISTLDFDFPDYARRHFDRLLAVAHA